MADESAQDIVVGARVNARAKALIILLVLIVPLVALAIWISISDVEFIDTIADYLPVLMFANLGILLFSGYPVAFILGGLAFSYGMIGYFLGVFSLIEFFNFLPRIWGQAAENLVLVAVPTFVFMGVMMERSGVAHGMLYCCQVLLRRVPGALALAVTVMGTILAAITGIIGASVTMMTALALPTMLRQKYSQELATGCIAASGTLGILIPPSIMLIIMADLLAVSVGTVFMTALGPGLILATFYLIYIATAARINPKMAPPLPRDQLYVPRRELPGLILKGFLPPTFLILLIKGSILFGFATPSEAGAVGAFGAVVLAAANRKLKWNLVKSVNYASALTIGMIFFIVMSATCFAYVFRSLGGDDIVEGLILAAGLGPWGLLLLIMAVIFVLGFFLDWIEITLIVLPVFGPLVVGLDFGDHLPGWLGPNEMMFWFIVLMALNLQTSFLTPPFGYAIFYLKGIAPEEVKIESIYRGIIPFVVLQLLAVIAVLAFPKLALYLPYVVYGPAAG
ncbi:MAG: TRAP transporter large permease subunit [Candidatus Methylomirabilia bacterium]